MKQKFTTGMLFISAILLGAFIWFVERNSEDSRLQEVRTQKIFAAYPAEISWIHMEREGVTIECVRTAGIWRMTIPVDAPVNSAVVEKMIAGMANVERGELITAKTMKERSLTPADYGFEEPRAKITFRNNRGTFTWLIGRDAPLGDDLYVMASGNQNIISAPQTLLNLIPKDPAWIRDRTLFKNTAASVRGIDLRRTGGFIQLRQTEENRWIIQQPFTGSADYLQVHQLIDHAVAATIRDFILDEPTDLTVYGLEDPETELSLIDQNEHPQSLLIGKPLAEKPETRYAKWADSPSVFTVASDWATAFELDSSLLRSRQIVDAQLPRISKVSITSGDGQIDLLRTNNLWKIKRPTLWDAEPKSVQTLLETLTAGTVAEFIDAPTAAQTDKIKNPQWTVEITAGNRTRTLRIHRTDTKDQLIIQRDDESSFCITEKTLFKKQFADPLFFRSRTLLEINPPQIKSIELQKADKSFRVEKEEDRFITQDRTQSPAADTLSELTAQLIKLRTDEFVAFNPESLETYGLETPEAQLTVTLNSTNTLGQVILFGKPAEGGRYAMLRGQPVVFVLPKKTAEILTRELTQPVEEQPTENERP
ncbi:DUF4340 domain-containing protein [Tichowtungia aerotolerans]|uniref:DUF4340 domain-containing protein n=1 Tax=Tichowtungia aerotolerans TaxID=2697043 RepID=A0A6P1M5D9_9BACT|nr:DUF4340 domain-containing protein [Tichowtungia aerotolerans]QHI68213.1 DUF4340 domain-containing protein [Tichowtungia aerotolerans]